MTELEKLRRAKIPCPETGITVKHTLCDICTPENHCGVDAYVLDGKVIKVEGTKEHPHNHGLLCTKGAANREYIYRADRLKTPMRRVGRRGEGRFEPITWEEAYDEITARLTKIKESDGPDAVAVFSGYTKWYRGLLKRFAYSFGTINYGTESSVCFDATMMAWLATTGSFAVPDMAHAATYIGWGYGPHYSSHLAVGEMQEFKARGGKLLIVDPKITPAVKMADLHLQLKPGTDGALALGIARVIFENGWQDQDYLDRFTVGQEAYRRECDKFDLGTVEQITGVPRDKVIAAAEMIAKGGPACMHQSASPITQHRNGYQNYRAILALLAVTGNYDRPGGNLPIVHSYNYQAAGFQTREREYTGATRPQSIHAPIGAGRFPAWDLFQDEFQAVELSQQILEEKPYPIKALLGFGMNLLMFPDTAKLCRALEKLDFFLDVDLFSTPCTRYADIVLPACTSFERGEMRVYPSGHAFFTKPVIDPLYDSRSDTDIITDLARRLAPQDELLCRGYEAAVDYMFQDLSVSVDSLKASEFPVLVPEAAPPQVGLTLANGFPTPSGKFELESSLLAQKGAPAVPSYPEELYHPQGNRKYILSTGVRLPNTLHSRLHNVPVLRSLRPEPMADISMEDAARLGLSRGDSVRLTTDGGSLCVKVNPTSAVLEGTIHLFHGYEEANANALIPADWLDPCTGFPAYKSIGCDMEPCAG